MASTIYNSFTEWMADGTMDLGGINKDTLKLALFTSASNAGSATNDYLGSLSNQVASGEGYTTGGQEIQNTSWENVGVAKMMLDGDNVIWGDQANPATITARFGVVYNATSGQDELICVFDFIEDKVCANGTFEVQFNSNGIITVDKA